MENGHLKILWSLWNGVQDRFSKLAAIAIEVIWMPVTSVEAEGSLSKF